RFHHDRSINQAEWHTSAVPASFGHKVTLARDDFDRSGRRRRSVSSVRNVGGSGRIGRVRHERARTFAPICFNSRGAALSSRHSHSGRMDGTNGGLAVAAALGIAAPKPPRVRVIIGLTAFGMIHLLAQRKGWTYHFYPLAVGLACWGAWTLA